MTVTVFGYQISISIDFYMILILRFSLVLVNIEKIYIFKHFQSMLLKNTPHFESIVFSTLFLVCRNLVKHRLSFLMNCIKESRRRVRYQSDINQQVRYQDKESLCGYKCLWCNELGNVKVTGYLPDLTV